MSPLVNNIFILVAIVFGGLLVIVLLYYYIKFLLNSVCCRKCCNKRSVMDFCCCRRRCLQCNELAHCKIILVQQNGTCDCEHAKHMSGKCNVKIHTKIWTHIDKIEHEKYIDYVDENYEEKTSEIIGWKDTPKQQTKIVGTQKVTKYRDVIVGQKEEEYEERDIINYQDEEYEEEVFDKNEILTNREYKYIRTNSVPYFEEEQYEETEYYTDYINKEKWVNNPHFGYRTAYVNGNPIQESYTEYRLEREVEYNVPVQKNRQVKKTRNVTKYKDEKVFDWVTTETIVPKMKLVTKTKSVPVYGMVKKTRMIDVIKSEPYEVDEDIIITETVIDKMPIYKIVVKQRKKPVEKVRSFVVSKPDKERHLVSNCRCKINNGHKCLCSKCKRVIDINTPLLTISVK